MNMQTAQFSTAMDGPVYINSAPNDGRWGQPPASYYTLRVVNGIMQGQLMVVTRQPMMVDQAMSSESVRPEILTAMESVLQEGAEVWKELANR